MFRTMVAILQPPEQVLAPDEQPCWHDAWCRACGRSEELHDIGERRALPRIRIEQPDAQLVEIAGDIVRQRRWRNRSLDLFAPQHFQKSPLKGELAGQCLV